MITGGDQHAEIAVSILPSGTTNMLHCSEVSLIDSDPAMNVTI